MADAPATIGHVHLTVSDLARSVAFYRDVIGFKLTQEDYAHGTASFLSSDGQYHHHLGLNTWAGEGAPRPPPRTTGLFHFAILYPDRPSLARAVQRVLDADWPLTGASDHGVSEAVYLDDPDGNGVELYRDRPEDAWPRDGEGRIQMVTEPLDLEALLAEAST